MTLQRITQALGVPALLMGALGVLFTLVAWLLRINGVPEALQGHLVAEKQYHDSSAKVITDLDTHAEDQERLLEAIVRGECIENPRENLARQGLLAKCRALGINR
jgi:hypothetical protein